MTPRYLLDTHIVVRWLATPKKLSREQKRVLGEAVRHREAVALSAMTLLEIAVLFGQGAKRSDMQAGHILGQIASNPIFEIIPLTLEIASEVAALGPSLHDPADRAIVATSRVHKLILITSDQRIIESKLVPTVS